MAEAEQTHASQEDYRDISVISTTIWAISSRIFGARILSTSRWLSSQGSVGCGVP